MKKTFYLICFSLLGLGNISCQKDESTAVVPSRVPVEFSIRSTETKGVNPLNDRSELKEQGFGLSAWYSPNQRAFDANSTLFVINHRFGTLDTDLSTAKWQGLSKNGDTVVPDPIYYPLDGSLSFFCYAPYNDGSDQESDVYLIAQPEASITEQLEDYLPGSPLIRFTPNIVAGQQIDFVAANPVLNWTKKDGVVQLDFSKHLTTRIQFHCNYKGEVNTGEKVVISRVAIQDIISSEYLYFTQDDENLGYKWCNTISPVDGSSSMPLSPYFLELTANDLTTEGLPKKEGLDSGFRFINETVNGRLYLLPQSFPVGSSATLDITYEIRNDQDIPVEENTLSHPLAGTAAWEAGKTVAYFITVGVAERKELDIQTVVINGWRDAENKIDPDENEQEIMY